MACAVMENWNGAFQWEVRGAPVERVWEITGDFIGVDKWITSLVQSCELAGGEPQKPGCLRRAVLYPTAPGQPSTYALEKLLAMDTHCHSYTYTILEGSLPGFSLMQHYVSTFTLPPLPASSHCSMPGTLLQWSFVCQPVPALTEVKAQSIAFSLYKAAVHDLKVRLSLPEGAIALVSSVLPAES